ncbi:FG-GAP-like repeat-containing protein [Pleurocapsa sp. CCALA 161]|uniref:FG-GAP-like repeat-containing protein n=1 Tax=Pleurocapsa sp. CCALA 161 TaxID=2107688 RepID=UPI0011B1FFDF|nr:FG-GAP-like repeat-containing protein [Pleurocapsa sp. CCALA 161]
MAISLSDLNNANGKNGLIIPGKTEGDRLGEAVTSAGDINGDGIDDLVVTAPNAGIPNTNEDSYYDSDRRGQAYVVFGARNSKNSQLDLNSLNGSNGFSVSGVDAANQLGSAVSTGDINGDGIDDLVLSAPGAGQTVSRYGYSYSENNGEAYVIFGTRKGFNADFNLQSLDGSNGFILKGIDASDLLGSAVTSAGDINGDGIDDLAVSATGGGRPVTNRNGFTQSDRRGEVYILLGKKNGFDARINLFNLNGSNGFIVDGKDANDSLGSALSNAGDINGDSIDDLVIGASNAGNVLNSPFADGDSDQRGEIYVVFGSKKFNSRFSVGDRFTFTGVGIEDNLGTAVTNAGDLNGDGIDDLVLGAANASVDGEYTQEGQVYVLFGRQDGFGTQFNLNSLNGNNGFSLAGVDTGDGLGNAVSAGDFNGDGIDDLLVGASSAGQDNRGAAYVVYGKRTGFTSQVDLPNLSSNAGVKIAGISSEDLFGSAVSSGGDLNGDGADDLLVTAPGVDLGNEYTKEGTTYVIFGKPQSQPQPQPQPQPVPANKATPNNDRIVGTSQNDQISAQNGNDTISGGDGNDNLAGDDGNDSLFGDSGNDTVNGGNNSDTLFGAAGNDLLDGGNNQDRILGDEGNDTLFGGTDNDFLAGGIGNDILNGTNPNNFAVQVGEQDTLVGGEGTDLFILGDKNQVYYDDRNSLTEGSTDYVLIEDFNSAQDKIQLKGDRSLYNLSFSADGQGNTLANILYLQPGAIAERIGILKNVSPNLNLNNSAFIYLQNESSPPKFNLIGGATSYSDKIKGSVLNDQISGNSGDDTISGGDGNDSLAGDGGSDALFGDSGNDTLNGGTNSDTLFGAAGNDLLDGGNNQDRLLGDDGNDTLFGGTDNDLLEGGKGNDTLNGTNPNNFELQFGEQDTLVGGADRDLFILGDKDRLYYSDRNSRSEGSTDYALIKDFNSAQDKIQLTGERSFYSLSLSAGSNGSTLANILYLEPGSTPERIGIIEDVSPNLTINHNAFTFI